MTMSSCFLLVVLLIGIKLETGYCLTGHVCSYQATEKYYRSTCSGLWCWSRSTVSALKYVTRYRCCPGWRYHDGCCCEAICPLPCKNGGGCVSPNTCGCSSGWAGNQCTRPICNTSCKNGGTCVYPETCKCSPGWTGQYCTKAICEPDCQHNGTCITPNKCQCSIGYTGPRCHDPICKTACFNKGNCIAPEKCKCDKHWTDDHCTTPVCNPPCSKGGICINPNECRYSVNTQGTKACQGKRFDVSFVVDTSGSIGEDNFRRMKNFMKNVVMELDVSSTLTHVSLIEFGTVPKIQFKLDDHLESTEVVLAIENTTFSGGSTSTSDALEMMRKLGFDRERPSAPNVGVVITDGLSKYPYLTRTQAGLAKQSGISMIAIGIGQDASHSELFGIASGQPRLFEVADFKKLLVIAEDVAKTICEAELPNGYTPRLTTTTTFVTATGDSCVDNGNCSAYARDMCLDYEEWARAHCPRTCGFCGNVNETTAVIWNDCKNAIDNCDQYGKYMCLDPKYYDWVLNNCAQFCGYCGNKSDATPPPAIVQTTTKAPAVCEDHLDNCEEYGGPSMCRDLAYKGWTEANCPKYCGRCYALRHYDAISVGPLRCPTWDLPEECFLKNAEPSCCPFPSCPPNFRLTVKRK